MNTQKTIKVVRESYAETGSPSGAVDALGNPRRMPAEGRPADSRVSAYDIVDPIPGGPVDRMAPPIRGLLEAAGNIALPSGLANRTKFAALGRGGLGSESDGGFLQDLGAAFSTAVATGLAIFLSPSDAANAVQGLSQFADAGGGSGIALGIGLFVVGISLWNGGGGQPAPLPLQAPALARQAKPAEPAIKTFDALEAQQAREQQEHDSLSYQIEANHLTESLNDPAFRRSLDLLTKREDAVGLAARNFLDVADTCLARLKGFKALADRYAETQDISLLDEMNAHWQKFVEPAVTELQSSPHYGLEIAYEATKTMALFDVMPLLAELTRQQVQSSKDGSMTYDYRFKGLDELTLDSRSPIRSVHQISTKNIVVIEIRVKTPEKQAEVENALKKNGYSNSLKMIRFEMTPARQ